MQNGRNKNAGSRLAAPRIVRATTAAVSFVAAVMLAGCSRAPTFNILGSFFPSWILCGVIGILLAVASRLFFVHIKLEDTTEAVDPRVSLPRPIFHVHPLASVLQLIRKGEAMPESDPTPPSKLLGRIVSISIIAAAVISGMLLIWKTNRYPRTDDAEVFANFIGIAPQVDGPITRLAVQDNAFVKQGELLFQIDPRPYEYALQKAQSDLNTLEGQIVDQRRTIASQVSGVGAARANTDSAAANVSRAAAAVDEAKANVANVKAALDSANAELLYTTNNYHRIEPLLAKQFVTIDQVDRARTEVTAKEQAVYQQRAQLLLAEAQVQSAQAQYQQAKAVVEQSHAQLGQSEHGVLTIEPLTAQREGRASAIRTAAIQPQQLQGARTFRRTRNQSEYLPGRLRPHRSASLHPDRYTHLVGHRELS